MMAHLISSSTFFTSMKIKPNLRSITYVLRHMTEFSTQRKRLHSYTLRYFQVWWRSNCRAQKLGYLTSVSHQKTPSSTIKAGQQGGKFLVSTYLIYPCPETNVCDVISNRVLPPSSGGKWRAVTMACIILGFWEHPWPWLGGDSLAFYLIT